MAIDPRKRQKKLERRKAKDKARNRAVAVSQSRRIANRFERVGGGRILDCLVPTDLWDDGIGQVLISREMDNGHVAHATFLVDAFCLGVKDVVFAVSSRGEYDRLLGSLVDKFEYDNCSGEFLRKLVEDSVAYARSVGLEPHSDYQQAQAIFGDLDASRCPQQFTFGRSGKPLFICGPNDSPQRCARIVTALTDRCGPGGFDYVLHLPQSKLAAAGLSRFGLISASESA
jgi:hypothetical protein